MSCVQKYIHEHFKYSPFSLTWFVFPVITPNWQCCGIISSAIWMDSYTRSEEPNPIQPPWCSSFDSFFFRHLYSIRPLLHHRWTEQAEASWYDRHPGVTAQKELKCSEGEGKKMLQSPLLLSLIKFSGLITIKPLSTYNNVCITEQHRCSPSTQLNIKVAVAVLIPARCVCERLCVSPPMLLVSPGDPQLHP